MNEQGNEHDRSSEINESRKPSRGKKILLWIAGIACVCAVVVGSVLLYIAKHAEPILRKRVIDTLAARFNSPVELDEFHIVVANGFGVTGRGLRIQYIVRPNEQGMDRTEPMLSVEEFSFRTNFHGLLESPMRVGDVHVKGLHILLPPKEERAGKLLANAQNDPTKQKSPPKESIIVDRILVDDVVLLLETNKPNKVPLDFEISHIVLKDVGRTRPFDYTATLVNPKPIGDIAAHGHFGPWDSDGPRDTPLDGVYSFDHADLNTIKGIGGMLSSKGSFGGSLGNISADGETDTPNFSLDVSNHPVPLHTKYHAIIDGTSGDVLLQPVQAWMLHSYFVCVGHVVKSNDPKGHDIALDVNMPKARIEDMLQLGVKTSPALMRGALTMKTKLHIPAGDVPVSKKIELSGGHFEIRNAVFTSDKIQTKIDTLSMRAQGKPGQANKDDADDVTSSMKGAFRLGHSTIDISDLLYTLPGAQVYVDGEYSLNGQVFDFHGKVRTKAKVSQMTTSWKSWLLKPVDPFFKKNGAGAEVPFKITGTKDEPHFGLELKQKKEDQKDTSKLPAPK